MLVDLLCTTSPTLKSLRIQRLIADGNNTDFPDLILNLEDIIDGGFVIADANKYVG